MKILKYREKPLKIDTAEGLFFFLFWKQKMRNKLGMKMLFSFESVFSWNQTEG